MRIVAASLSYVAGKFGGSTRSRKLPSTTHASTDADDGKELSTSFTFQVTEELSLLCPGHRSITVTQ